MLTLGLAWLVLAVPCAQAQSAEAPFALGLCARAEGGEGARAFVAGARLAVDIRNRRGGVFGHPLELVLLGGAGSRREARAALDAAAGVTLSGVIAPWSSACGALVREACERRDLAVVGTVQEPAREAEVLVGGLTGALGCTRIALLADASPAAKSLQKELERRLAAPHAIVLAARIDARDLAKRLAEARADVLILDAPPEDAAAALRGALAGVRTPVVLASRAVGTLAGLERELLFVHGLSPATANASPAAHAFLEEYRARHGEPGCGAVEGFELVELLAAAIERAGSGAPAAVRAALATTRIEGPRGPVAAAGGVVLPLPALWRLTDHARPHLPPTLAEGETIPDGAGRTPDVRLGAPFGALRTAAFRCEPDTRCVRVHFGRAEVASIDADLAHVGLSTGGVSPFVDHLVREELLARTLSIASQKYLRDERGRAIPGQSFKVSFAAHLPPGEHETWDAQLAGADPSASGRAFPGDGHCEVFATNWLATVLANALEPPIGAADLGLLDGTYVFGSDYKKDRRSELIRALVQVYASYLGLNTAHEVGHLFGLDHDTGDMASLMSTDEERGLAPEDSHFNEEALERLRRTPGVVK